MAVSFPRVMLLRKQRGVALITALLVVALATVTAVAMASRQQLDVRRTANLLQGDQAYAYALAVESWARVVLLRDAKDPENKTDSLNDDWAQQLPPLTVPGGQVGGYVLDLSGRFNLNNLLKPEVTPKDDPDVLYFQRLLRVLELNDQLVYAIQDWVDGDFETRLDGAEDEVYQSAELPYRAANRPFQSVSELRLVKGFDAATWNKLAPYLCALPVVGTSLNVNTAAAPLLQALSEDLSSQDVEQLVEGRGDKGYKTFDEFAAHEAVFGRTLFYDANALSVTSEYFLVRAEVDVGSAHMQLFSVMQRNGGIETLSRTQGTW